MNGGMNEEDSKRLPCVIMMSDPFHKDEFGSRSCREVCALCGRPDRLLTGEDPTLMHCPQITLPGSLWLLIDHNYSTRV
ncbi:unnamed protein product [Amoebophrya sp. A25]|nr:unnamed protein product [Amoebophrya sp. A25]|eukprot:GSA25T00012069001.1